MTHDAATEVIQAQSHRRQMSTKALWIVMPILAIFAVVSLAVSLLVLTRQRQAETSRANQASVAVEELCDQVRRMGAVCVVNPDDFRGERGDIGPTGERGAEGPAGRAPTEAEIAAAVVAYLLANPPSAGPPGPTGPQGDRGDSAVNCPAGFVLRPVTVRPANGGKPIQILACVRE